MKTSLFFLATLTVCSLCLTSCGNNSLTEEILLDDSNQIINTEITNRSVGEPFKFEQLVALQADDAFGDIEKFGARGPDAEVNGQMERYKKQPNLAITGIGDSRILNWGSWYVVVDLSYDPINNSVSGTLMFTFPDYGEEVEFGVTGQPALITDNNDKQLVLQLDINQGTGSFEDKTFEGSAVIQNVGSLVETGGDINTYLVINGTVADR